MCGCDLIKRKGKIWIFLVVLLIQNADLLEMFNLVVKLCFLCCLQNFIRASVANQF